MGNGVIFAHTHTHTHTHIYIYIYIYIVKCQLLLHYKVPPIQGLEYRCHFLDYVLMRWWWIFDLISKRLFLRVVKCGVTKSSVRYCVY
jgi:hypothetical protein